MEGSLWPAVYQGLDVYHEPSGPLSAPPAASLLGFTSFSQGEHPALSKHTQDPTFDGTEFCWRLHCVCKGTGGIAGRAGLLAWGEWRRLSGN